MDPLRWLLLGGVLLVIVGIWGFEAWRRRRAALQGAEGDPDAGLLRELEGARDGPGGEGDLDLDGLAGLSGSRSDAGDPDPAELERLVAEHRREFLEVEPESMPVRHRESRVYAVEPGPAPEEGEELIVVLNVMAEPGDSFSGPDLLDALRQVEMEHGDMRIFHHYGVGEMRAERPVFSLANILEPGYFEPAHMEDFSTPGCVLFMRLPGPLDGRVAFELMLATGQRLAERLGGELRDETRSVLTPRSIGDLRERIAARGRR
jgi:cell division protein ZipA